MARLIMLRPRLGEQAKLGAWHDTSSTSRGYGHEWRKQRDHVMARDCGICQQCHRAGRTSLAYAVDHITPKAEGGTDAEGNLEAICRPCHTAKTAEESGRARAFHVTP